MKIHLKQIILFCADVEKLVRFYQDCFGFSVAGVMDKNWTVLETGQTQIAFHKIGEQYLNVPADEFNVGETNVKLVFEINEDLSSFRQSLISKKADVDEIKQFTGYPYLVCDGRDPEGNVFQLLKNI